MGGLRVESTRAAWADTTDRTDLGDGSSLSYQSYLFIQSYWARRGWRSDVFSSYIPLRRRVARTPGMPAWPSERRLPPRPRPPLESTSERRALVVPPVLTAS